MRLYFISLLLISSSLATRHGGAGGSGHSSSHSYPHSTGLSGTGSGGGAYYSHNTGLSGNSRAPNTRNYNNNQQQHSSQHMYSSKSEVHHHYHYSPPQQIHYGSTYHPVFHGSPPVYVYEYRNSGSRFDNLLTGLALYNLGRMSASRHDSHYHREYTGTPGEICKLGISKRTGEYEETRIDCRLMSSFILEASSSPAKPDVGPSKTVSTTVTNTTSSNTASGNTSVSTVTVTNTTVTDALTVKGPSIEVTPGMTCYMIRISSYSNLKKNVECGLLQEYARSSLRSDSERLKPVMMLFLITYSFSLYTYLIEDFN